MRAFGRLAIVSLLALTACGERTTDGESTGAGQTIVLRRTDAGRTVSLEVGDRLDISLGSAASVAGWRLVLYPKRALSLKRSDGDGFLLRAKEPGRGRVVALDPSRASGACEGIRPKAKPPLACPLMGSGGGVPPRPGVFGVIVEVR